MSGIDLATLTPPQRRVLHELFAVGSARPPVDPGLVLRLQTQLRLRTASAARLRPAGAPGLRLNKSALEALACEGRYLDTLDTPFVWSPRLVLGTLVHRSIELDHAGRRARAVAQLVTQAWGDLAAQGNGAGAYLTGLGGVQADGLRADTQRRVLEFRECFPLVPTAWNVRLELALTVQLHGGAVTLLGKPDLVLGGGHPTQRRLLVIDLKTGRRSAAHRRDLRFYALLATLKYATAPFRVATYYLDEAEWEAEDVDDDLLEGAARTVAEQVNTAARLQWARPAAANLRLVPGPACSWCGRQAVCGAYAPAPGARPLAVAS